MAALPLLVADPADFVILTGHDDADAGRVNALLAQASKRVRKHCGWHIYPSLTNDVLVVNGTGTSLIELPTLYVEDVASVVEDGVTLVEGTDYDWDDTGSLFRIGRAAYGYGHMCNDEWTRKKRAVTVTLTHGYDEVPEDVAGIVCEMVAAALESSLGATQENANGIQAFYLTNGISLSAAQRQALGAYTIRTA